MTAEEQFAAQKEALDVVRPLLATEETRSANLNTRALGMISASSLVIAIAGIFAKDVLTGAALKQLGKSRDWALGLLMGSVGFLALAVCLGVWTLWPRTRQFVRSDTRFAADIRDLDGRDHEDLVAVDHLRDWQSARMTDETAIRTWALRATAIVLADLRAFDQHKVRRLKSVYFVFALAVVLVAADAMLFFDAGFSVTAPPP